jgi:hypothetical protein
MNRANLAGGIFVLEGTSVLIQEKIGINILGIGDFMPFNSVDNVLYL